MLQILYVNYNTAGKSGSDHQVEKEEQNHCVPTARVLLSKAIHSISKPPWPYLSHSHFSFLHNYEPGKFNGIENVVSPIWGEIKLIAKYIYF